MTKNDTFYKILFAIELALIPLVIYAYHFLEQVWTMPLFIMAIFVCRVWMEIFKDKYSFQHNLINAIGGVVTLAFLLIFFACVKVIALPIAVISIIALVLANAMKMCFFGKHVPEIIEAVEFCYMMFECLTILTLAFVLKFVFVTNVAMFALMITGFVTAGYRIFYAFKYTDLWLNIKKLFRRK